MRHSACKMRRAAGVRAIGKRFVLYPRQQVDVSCAARCARRNASGKPFRRSVATRECSPTCSRITSPASPCKCTAAQAARSVSFGLAMDFCALAFCAMKPATMPVRMSPVPPVDIPGFPVVLTHASPSGRNHQRAMPFQHDDHLMLTRKSPRYSQAIVLHLGNGPSAPAAPSRPDAA